MRRVSFFILFLVPLLCHADSDGIMCVGEKYVAIDIRGLLVQSSEPIIRLVYIGEGGELKLIDVPAKSDSNRSLSCHDRTIYLSNGFKVELKDFENPEYIKTKLPSEIEFSSLQLPYIGKSQVLSIPAEGFDSTYSLILSYAMETPRPGVILHHNAARVVKTDKRADFVESKLLAEGVRYESVD